MVRVCPFHSSPSFYLSFVRVRGGALLNVTSRWFFGLIRRRLAAAVTSLYCKENSESEQEGGLAFKKRTKERETNPPDGAHTSGASTLLMYRTWAVLTN